MKVLYGGVQKERYDPKRRGMSFEYQSFFRALQGMEGIEVVEFPFDPILEMGREHFQAAFFKAVQQEKPALVFLFMHTDELLPETLRRVRDELHIPIVGWFADDYWRFWNYSRHYAPVLSLAVTTSLQAVGWYKSSGLENVFHSQWACNTRDFYPIENLPQDIDVSFVGQYKPPRARLFKILAEVGIEVRAFGVGWPGGRVSHEELLRIFAHSKINLNIADRPALTHPKVLARLFLKKSLNEVVPDFHFRDNFKSWMHFKIPHIHARPFELAGSRAFTLSSYVEGIEKYYEPDKEMVFFKTPPECIEKIKYFLGHSEERMRIREAGYARTLQEHTYEARFREIFKKIGLG
ncbi:MAG: glycosyltransferase [Candidatus Liptonbacteria bacterium]|nr:glycosyltransferase [Candidatus Liptonbacteria bacterium]